MRVELIRCNGFGRKETIIVDQLPIMIGSNPDAGIRLSDRRANRVHCLLAEYQDRLLVRDLNSKHGTYVNGVRIKEVPLASGDRLTIGKSQFVVHTVNGSAEHDSQEGKTLFVVSDDT